MMLTISPPHRRPNNRYLCEDVHDGPQAVHFLLERRFCFTVPVLPKSPCPYCRPGVGGGVDRYCGGWGRGAEKAEGDVGDARQEGIAPPCRRILGALITHDAGGEWRQEVVKRGKNEPHRRQVASRRQTRKKRRRGTRLGDGPGRTLGRGLLAWLRGRCAAAGWPPLPAHTRTHTRRGSGCG